MLNIKFIEKYLNEKVSKHTIISMTGIIQLNLKISNFKFEINVNKLSIIDNEEKILIISFDEVRRVQYESNKIYIEFNINEKIIIK